MRAEFKPVNDRCDFCNKYEGEVWNTKVYDRYERVVLTIDLHIECKKKMFNLMRQWEDRIPFVTPVIRHIDILNDCDRCGDNPCSCNRTERN